MNGTVLIVEDDDVHAELIRRSFETKRNGFEVVRVDTLAGASAEIAERRPAVVLSDWHLPDGNGTELLKRDGDGRLLYPVILMTSYGNEALAVEAMKLGALDYIVKSRETLAGMANLVHSALREWDQIQERLKAEEQLRESLAEKEILLKEVHHRVKNNFQIVSSLLHLQASYIPNEGTKEILRESENRIRSMALIHEKLYQAENFSRIDFSDYVEAMTKQLFGAYEDLHGRTAISCVVEPLALSLDVAVPLGLVLNELITNALKYAFPDARPGKVCVRLRPSERVGFYALEVSDNGIGIPESVSLRDGETLGLQLVSLLTDQIGGSVELDRSAGTRFTITFAQDGRGQPLDLSRHS
jgi:two-component sensor histidine kinase